MAVLTYLQVHFYYNIPPLILCALLYRPLITSGDIRKYCFLISIAVLYTTPWDNYIIYRKAWQYCPTCVMGTIGLVPVEEYLFFATQTLLTCLVHSLLTRCLAGLPAIAIRRHKNLPLGIYATLVGLLATLVMWMGPAWYDQKTFYMRAILLWTTPVLLFLFTLTGLTSSFICYRLAPTLLSVVLPTLYLWIIDSIAIRAGTWHINENTSLESFVWNGLPIEEAVFFVVTNTMVVLGCNGFDLAYSIIHTYEQITSYSFASLCRALLQSRDESVVQDLEHCVHVLRQGSSSFYNSSFFFGESVRRDLIVLYSFCRYTDDVTDNTDVDPATRSTKLLELTRFVIQNFSRRSEIHIAKRIPEAQILQNENPIQRSMLRFIAHKVPREPIIELLKGYEWDLELDTDQTRRIQSEQDLISYSNHVASSVAEMCMYIIDPRPQPHIVAAAREMGVVLQFTNVARDILTDAAHGRTYVPETWFEPGHRDLLLKTGKIGIEALSNTKLIEVIQPEQYALRLMAIANTIHERSTKAIDELPEDVQVGIRIATDGYFAIGKYLEKLCQARQYPPRARLSRTDKMKLMLKHLYRPSKTEALLLGGCALRLILLVYGHWQDNQGASVKYTDIDYNVFSDAARFVQAGKSPYERSTYRYTPALAWLLIPNQYLQAWGKLLFATGDILAGWLTIKLLRRRRLSVVWSAIWLLNPMVAVISTRGNCEGLLGAMMISLLYALEKRRVVLAGCLLGLAVHFKVYPIIYAPSAVWALATPLAAQKSSLQLKVFGFFTRDRLVFGLVGLVTFSALSSLMFHIYGMEFIEHTFLYHISRSDHRHNFSPYHLYLYLSSAPNIDLKYAKLAPLFTFLPQMALSLVVIPLALAKRDLATCFFAQTFAFVTFNKVVTSQYFMWYLVFLPLYLPRSPFISRLGIISLAAWIAGQALWLYFAYGFEILGKNTFTQMWISTLLFFLVNIFILGKVVEKA